MTQFEIVRAARDIVLSEAAALDRLARSLPADFEAAVDKITSLRGAVIVTGMGKAGWIGQKLSATFASTGTRSHFLHPAEAAHGDLGRIHHDDLVLALSNSGETDELIQILPSIRKIGSPLVALTAKLKSTLSDGADLVLNYEAAPEACALGLAPSTSTTTMLALGDALALVVSQRKGFQPSDFAQFHPGGSLGRKLSTVDEIMRPIEVCRVASESKTIREIYTQHQGPSRRAGAILLVDNCRALTGIFTDSDLAKILERGHDHMLDQPIANCMTRKPITIKTGERTMLAVEMLACNNISELPIIDGRHRPIGLIDITDVLGLLPK